MCGFVGYVAHWRYRNSYCRAKRRRGKHTYNMVNTSSYDGYKRICRCKPCPCRFAGSDNNQQPSFKPIYPWYFRRCKFRCGYIHYSWHFRYGHTVDRHFSYGFYFCHRRFSFHIFYRQKKEAWEQAHLFLPEL